MTEFFKESLPFVLIGLSIAIFFAGYRKNHGKEEKEGEENKADLYAMGPRYGVAIGIAIGTANDSIGSGLGAGIGMFIGSIIEYVIQINRK